MNLYYKIGNFLSKYKFYSKDKLNLKGINTGEIAFIGPDEVHIDLTNKCNNECIGCWCRSRLLGKKIMSPELTKAMLSFDVLKKLIKDLGKLGCKRIKLIGGGEPFMHPQILDVIMLIKNLGMECRINTNFNLVTPEIIKKLVQYHVDLIDVSVWAGDSKTYVDTHLNQTEKTFDNLKNSLELISKYKKQYNTKFPEIRIYNVILNNNYSFMMNMVDFALSVDADVVQFNHIDTIKDKTECLLLDNNQKEELIKICDNITSFIDVDDHRHVYNCHIIKKNGKEIQVHAFLNDFVRRIKSDSFNKGNYDVDCIEKCYVGWLFARVMADGNVIPCLKSHKIPSGNLYNQSFPKIWNGSKQRLFREMGKSISKNKNYFKQVGNDDKYVGCYRTCDNFYQNEEIERLK